MCDETSCATAQTTEKQYDMDSEREDTVGDDELTFLRAVTTHNGQAVQVKFFS